LPGGGTKSKEKILFGEKRMGRNVKSPRKRRSIGICLKSSFPATGRYSTDWAWWEDFGRCEMDSSGAILHYRYEGKEEGPKKK